MWASAAALSILLLMAGVLLGVVVINGMGAFWPSPVAEVVLVDGSKLLGQPWRSDVNPDTGKQSIQFKLGNREQQPGRQDFRWVAAEAIRTMDYPADVYILERTENGDFVGYLKALQGPDVATPGLRSFRPQAREKEGAPSAARLGAARAAVHEKAARLLGPIAEELAALSSQLQSDHLTELRLRYRAEQLRASSRTVDHSRARQLHAQIAEVQARARRMKQRSDQLVARQQELLAALRQNVAKLANASGEEKAIALLDIVRFYQPNAMDLGAKLTHYLAKVGELLWENPRESNTEGGLFPAIFGTVMLVFLMAVACFPLGVLGGIYLGEYARDGWLVRVVRIAVNNLAGIPSIVYGIFGLGFFVYGVGGLIDQWFFPERVAAGTPTFGTGGILWASMTLGLLTVPVVIVATEEALRTIPQSLRESSLALGATKFQTLVRVLLPMASPGMMTGFILAMARAAGEVAPLMITGAVKLAPALPLDGTFPFVHLDRKFMHLGFHIYDVGFQSPNVEASKPMVFVTTLLLLLIVVAMTSTAVYLRNRMRRRYQVRTI